MEMFINDSLILKTGGLGDAQVDRGFTVNTHDLTVLVNANKTFEIYTRLV